MWNAVTHKRPRHLNACTECLLFKTQKHVNIINGKGTLCKNAKFKSVLGAFRAVFSTAVILSKQDNDLCPSQGK